jgi:oligoribonuclease (3'-5' exoribonuclease)
VPPALLFRRQACRESPTSLAEAEQAVLEFVQHHVPEPSIAQIAGNSVHVDLAFLRKHMPRLVDHLSYRIVDVSTVGELCRRWFPREHSRAPKKRNTHTAMSGGWVVARGWVRGEGGEGLAEMVPAPGQCLPSSDA